MASPNWPEKSRVVFGTLDVVTATVLAIGVFIGLPARWLPLDAPAGLLVFLLAVAGIGLLLDASWSESLARVAIRVVLAFALLFFGFVASSISYLYGIYGAVGRGGATLFILIAALAIPYLFALPVTELLWLGSHKTGKPAR
jgi:hypothetical protein